MSHPICPFCNNEMDLESEVCCYAEQLAIEEYYNDPYEVDPGHFERMLPFAELNEATESLDWGDLYGDLPEFN